MKTCMILLAVLAVTGWANAQNDVTPAPSSAAPTSQRSPYITTSLHHARLDEVIKQIAAASGDNVILSAPGVPPNQYPVIDSFELHDVPVAEALRTLKEIAVPKISLVEPPNDVLFGQRPGYRGTSDRREIYIVKYDGGASADTPAPGGAGEPQLVKIYNLSEMAAKSEDRINEVLSLIEAATTEGAKPFATVKFHRQTNTLIVRGTQPQQTVVSDVIASQMPAAPAPRENRISYYAQDINQVTVNDLDAEALSKFERNLQQQLVRIHQLQQVIAKTTTMPAER